MMLKNKKLFTLLALAIPFLFFPKLIYGVFFGEAPAGVKPIIISDLLTTILDIIWPVVFTLVIMFFIIAGFKFITAQGDPNELATARRFLMWGILGVIVIILAFSIVWSIRVTFNL